MTDDRAVWPMIPAGPNIAPGARVTLTPRPTADERLVPFAGVTGTVGGPFHEDFWLTEGVPCYAVQWDDGEADTAFRGWAIEEPDLSAED